MQNNPRPPLDRHSIWGLLLIGVGALFLMDSLNIFAFSGRLILSIAFFGGAAVFLSVVVNSPQNWWALFPAFMLGFIGLMIGKPTFALGFIPDGSLFLGGMGLCFLAVYAIRRDHFWPIIPGGVLLTLALVSGMHGYGGWLFFFGLAATFAVVFQVAGARREDSWALIVAVACAALGVLILGGMLLRLLFPVILVGLGVYLLIRSPRNQ